MKKYLPKLFSLVLFLFLGINSYGQASFYGVRLGMSSSEVKSVLEAKGKEYQTTTPSKPTNYDYFLKISNPRIGDTSFENAIFYFKDGKLTEGRFYCSDDAGGNPNAFAFDRVEKNAQDYYKTYQTMYANLVSKYGQANVSNDTRHIWIKSQYKIELHYAYDDHMEYGVSRQARAFLALVYCYNTSDY